VIDLIKIILDLYSLWFSWFVTNVSGQHIRENIFMKNLLVKQLKKNSSGTS